MRAMTSFAAADAAAAVEAADAAAVALAMSSASDSEMPAGLSVASSLTLGSTYGSGLWRPRRASTLPKARAPRIVSASTTMTAVACCKPAWR